METAFFWIIWGIISFWALKNFYFSFSKEKLEGLRKANIGFTIAVLILYFLPWVPLSLDGWTGFGLAYKGNFLATLFFIFLLNSLVLFFQKEYIFLKTASILTIFLTLDLFVLMLVVRPGTFTLSLYDIAPIIAILILLCQIVAVLLLWQQMQLQSKTIEVTEKRKKIVIAGVSVLITVLGLSIWFSGNSSRVPNPKLVLDEQKAARDDNPKREKVDTLARHNAGLVCNNNLFSFQSSSPYTILYEGKNRLALVTKGTLLIVSNVDGNPIFEIESILKQKGTKYTKEGELFIYKLTSNKKGGSDSEIPHAISMAKDTFAVTVFYRSPTSREQAEQILEEVGNTIKGGCE